MPNKNLTQEMNHQLANWNVLNTKLHNYHWYVTGPSFFTLHEKFEAFYNEAATNIDEIAERILTIGESPIATLKEYLNEATIKEATGDETPADMVAALVKDFETISDESAQLIEVAEDNHDNVTADMFIAIKSSIEQHIWMLNAYLGNKRSSRRRTTV
ncbi:DNA starvation/stationary phase protection protein [Salipaludibacillus agaradhaerens]|uniref:Dps family protein n=1 Tax=Salipaludibacillus agaradhaerens TaxID=76935 RepID=UPI002151D7A0|nr:Dps family protein [Salipaludibacillus agaradhaerens]MCR6105285.1 DNA starvation/stationary phase protection protein [Salipaludibacillus agaradhaerens]MCR6117326.1 DNA starvation/stationary phase protection protein [Salipaludibacillus agaradhaerens]UJW56529.1 DNA starvation/stationary phase protection protein [Bacillus sp. A116_S68]